MELMLFKEIQLVFASEFFFNEHYAEKDIFL